METCIAIHDNMFEIVYFSMLGRFQKFSRYLRSAHQQILSFQFYTPKTEIQLLLAKSYASQEFNKACVDQCLPVAVIAEVVQQRNLLASVISENCSGTSKKSFSLRTYNLHNSIYNSVRLLCAPAHVQVGDRRYISKLQRVIHCLSNSVLFTNHLTITKRRTCRRSHVKSKTERSQSSLSSWVLTLCPYRTR